MLNVITRWSPRRISANIPTVMWRKENILHVISRFPVLHTIVTILREQRCFEEHLQGHRFSTCHDIYSRCNDRMHKFFWKILGKCTPSIWSNKLLAIFGILLKFIYQNDIDQNTLISILRSSSVSCIRLYLCIILLILSKTITIYWTNPPPLHYFGQKSKLTKANPAQNNEQILLRIVEEI